jgi:hypothetical protein
MLNTQGCYSPLVSEARSRGATVTAELPADGSAGEIETTVMLTE